MNEEELMNEYEILKDQLFNERETYNFIDKLGYDDWNKKEVIRKYIKHIRQENKELHNKIDKAYEIVKDVSYGLNINFDDVLEILKDSDVDG